jgi:hypothetical protein
MAIASGATSDARHRARTDRREHARDDEEHRRKQPRVAACEPAGTAGQPSRVLFVSAMAKRSVTPVSVTNSATGKFDDGVGAELGIGEADEPRKRAPRGRR